MQLDQAAVEYAASKLHQVKNSRGLPSLSATFLRGNIFSEHWSEQLGGPFDCVHVGGSCSKDRIGDLMRLVKQGITANCTLQLLCLLKAYHWPSPFSLHTVEFVCTVHQRTSHPAECIVACKLLWYMSPCFEQPQTPNEEHVGNPLQSSPTGSGFSLDMQTSCCHFCRWQDDCAL